MIKEFTKETKEFTKETGLQRGTDFSSMEYRDLVEILVDYLRDKRYFLVFDDVWSIEFWKLICVALPDDIRGSRLMITTRDERVANFSYGSESRVHHVQSLSVDKAWELFYKNAFPRNHEQSVSPNIEPMARNLVHKCKGLPLAIVTLGSMMSTRRSETEWRKVENRLNWELSNNPELKDIHRFLLLSFSDLPYPLKHCFLFSSIFPEDDKIEGKSLIRMWMGQGFVDSHRGVELEEVADGYLMELVYRNLLQVVSRNIHGRPKAFKMHDMVREVALIVSKEERFGDIYNDEIEEGQHNETRHLCIQREMSSNMMTRWSIHTLLVRPTIRQNIGLPEGFKLLRVLDLRNSDMEKLPDSLVTLYNLKYLSLWGTLGVVKLPKSFHRLINLETLVTKFSGIDEFPVGISKLRNLRYLIVECDTRMKDSSDIWQLKRLQVLDGIHVETQFIKNLGKMTKLTKIGLWEVRKNHENDLSDSLNKLSDLRSLSLFSMDGEILPIDALSHTTKIEKLQLAGKLERLPNWFKTLHKLTRLRLGASSLGEDAISCIGGIPNLVKLSIYNNAYEGDRLCFQEGFPCLKVLEVSTMRRLKDIVIAKGAMPHLQKLKIGYCKGVKRVPDGIENLTKLEKLSLFEASDELLGRIRGENGIDRLKVNHIPIIKYVSMAEDGLISTEKL
ncbi:PREDICTED: disease resistance protein RPM1-like [Tarenaya hassleriana]|uniref:disease resistance protein RPM1-like n=1 Tax=Tarenaya hassleriana TaxID=28532 RepID=UPI0008FD105B|nr:PREDICTED: disease resistance protein RPM1-like [Tarenaya hassleriana]